MRAGRIAPFGRVDSLALSLILASAIFGPYFHFLHNSFATHGDTVNLTNDIQESNNPSIAISTDDTIYVAWRDLDSSFSGEIIVGSSVDGDSLDTIVNASKSELRSANPDITISSTGDVYVVWEEGDPREIFIANSTDNFGTPINISSNNDVSSIPRLAVSSTGDVYVVWVDQGPTSQDIFIANSTDNFATPINISSNDGESANPDIAISSTGDVHVVWEEVDIGEIFIANSTDNFATPINISGGDGGSVSPRLGVSNTDMVYVVWSDMNPVSFFVDIFIANSTDNFSLPINISDNDLADSSNPDIAVSDADVVVAWDEFDYITGSFELRSAASFSGGNFGTPINIAISSTGSPTLPKVAISSTGDIYVVWVDQGPTSTDIYSKGKIEFGEASIAITALSNSSPKWDLDEVIINGTNNGFSADDMVIVDWGDGSQPDEVSISSSDGSWSATHTYDSAAIAANPNFITASLVAPDASVKATSDPSPINVAKHSTEVTINHIPSIALGENVVVTGSLFDADAGGIGIGAKTISFTGTGSSGLSDAITGGDGEFSSVGSSPGSAGELWAVQPHFAGDDLYSVSDGNTKGYNIAADLATEFDLASGSGSFLNLTGFGASVEFDQPLNSGTVFVSSCDAPSSARYIDLGICLVVALGSEFSSDNMAHVGISFSEATIPSGYTEDNVSIFYEGLSGIVDLTESRDPSTNRVDAGTIEFGKFIVAIALHEDQAPEDIREEIFVGENQISANPPHITTDKKEYLISDTPQITIADINANIDITERETVSAFVSSTTSGTEGIEVDFLETDDDSGIFAGTFTFTSATSSGNSLQASDGDEIAISYTSYPPRFNATLHSILEAGVADMSSFRVPSSGPIRPYVGGVMLHLLDAANSPGGNITVTMSYANVDLNGAEGVILRLFHQQEGMEWENITIPGGNDDLNRLIVGVTNSPGIFVIGCDSQQQGCGGPGGGGGGLPRPGTGVVLDAVAVVVGGDSGPESSRSSGGSGGGGGSRSTVVTPVSPGSDMETTVRTESGIVTVQFENVEEASGLLKIHSNGLAAYDELFDEMAFLSQDNDEHGIVSLNGDTYSTVGVIFDIDAAAVQFTGTVDVTVPYDEESVMLLALETNVRFIHYNEEIGEWEDKTARVDVDANTVTGMLTSLSPVVAAIVLDDGENLTNMQNNPALRFDVTGPSIATSETGQNIMTTSLSNLFTDDQDYVIIVQVVNEAGVVQHIDWQTGSLQAGASSNVSLSWNQMDKGVYTVQIFLLTDLENPWLLSAPVKAQLVV